MENKFKQIDTSFNKNTVLKNTLDKVYRKLQPDHCFVAFLEPDGKEIRTAYHLCAGLPADSFVYPLAGSAWQFMLRKKALVSYCADAQQQFPTDPLLKKFKANVFIATLLHGDDKQEIGLLVCLFEQPIEEHAAAVDWLLTLSHISTQQGGLTGYQHSTNQLLAQLETGERVTKMGSWRWDISHNLYAWSKEVYRIFELDPAVGDISCQELTEYVHVDDRARVLEVLSAIASGQQTAFEITYRIVLANGNHKHLHVIGQASDVLGERPLYFEGTVQDVTELSQLNLDKQLSDFVFNHTSESVMITNSENKIISVNQALEQLTGYSQTELCGRNPNVLSSGLQDQDFYQQMWRTINQQGHWKGELWNKHKNGQVFPEELVINRVTNEQGNISHYVAIFRDISQWKATEHQLRFYAECDPLTKLTNRRAFIEQLELHLQGNGSIGISAVVCIDVDHFKEINDIYGNDVGDLLLVETAQQLTKITSEHDIVCRYGGNEFTLLLAYSSREKAKKIVKKIQRSFHHGIKVADFSINVTVSIGVAMYPDSGLTAKLLLRHASHAMANAKQTGRNCIAYYDVKLQRQYQRKLELKEQLIQALEQQQLQVFYQPIVDISSNSIAKFEALVRWPDGDGGYISPEQFIPIAEEFGLIAQVGNFVLDRACLDLKALHQQGYQHICFSINRSISEFYTNEIKQQSIAATIAAAGLPYESIVIEITESIAMSENRYAKQALAQLKSKGIKIALDDFCTGYSSLNYLIDYEIDLIKIDRSFVKGIGYDIKSQILTSTVLELAIKLGLEVIAEGVETEQQLDFLRQSGCHFIQGFIFSPALNITDCQQLLAQDILSITWQEIVNKYR